MIFCMTILKDNKAGSQNEHTVRSKEIGAISYFRTSLHFHCVYWRTLPLLSFENKNFKAEKDYEFGLEKWN